MCCSVTTMVIDGKLMKKATITFNIATNNMNQDEPLFAGVFLLTCIHPDVNSIVSLEEAQFWDEGSSPQEMAVKVNLFNAEPLDPVANTAYQADTTKIACPPILFNGGSTNASAPFNGYIRVNNNARVATVLQRHYIENLETSPRLWVTAHADSTGGPWPSGSVGKLILWFQVHS